MTPVITWFAQAIGAASVVFGIPLTLTAQKPTSASHRLVLRSFSEGGAERAEERRGRKHLGDRYRVVKSLKVRIARGGLSKRRQQKTRKLGYK